MDISMHLNVLVFFVFSSKKFVISCGFEIFIYSS